MASGAAGTSDFVVQVLLEYPSLPPKLKQSIDELLRSVDTSDLRVLRLRLGLDGGGLKTLSDVASELGITRQEARRAEARALSILRHPGLTWPAIDLTGVRVIRKAETLLFHIERLTEDNDSLRTRLAEALGDLAAAQARVRDLEDLTAMLRRELYETRSDPDRAWLGLIATLIAGLLGGFLGGFGQAIGEDVVADANAAAIEVVAECDLQIPPPIFRPAPPTTQPPATIPAEPPPTEGS